MKEIRTGRPLGGRNSEGQIVTVPGTGNFLIKDGKRIWLEAPPIEYYWANREDYGLIEVSRREDGSL